MLDLPRRLARLGPPPRTAAPGIQNAIAREELTGIITMYRARFVGLLALCIWIGATIPWERSIQYFAVLSCFVLLGLPPYILASRGVRLPVVTAIFLLADVVFLTYLLVIPPPFTSEGWTAQLNLRLPSFIYLAMFLVGVSLCYSPALVLWTGAAVTLSWATAFLWIAGLPESRVHTAQQVLESEATASGIADLYLHPAAVSLTRLINQVVFFVLTNSTFSTKKMVAVSGSMEV